VSTYQSKYSGEEIDAFFDEIFDARGSRGKLGYRIGNISNFASPNSGGNLPGRYYDAAFHAAGTANFTTGLNRVDIYPFYLSQSFKMDTIAINVVTAAAAGALARILIYDATLEGWPKNLLFEGNDLDIAATGMKSQAVDITIDSGRQYWIGVHTSLNAGALSGIPPTSLTNLGLTGGSSNGGSIYCTVLRKTIPFADRAPATWGDVVDAQLAHTAAPSIRMRCAAAA